MCLHIREHWRHLANMIELVLPSAHLVHNLNGKSTGSAVLAQLTAESPNTYNGLFFPPKLPLLMAVSGPPSVGGVVQQYSIGLWPMCFRCPALDLQLMRDQLCG